MESVFEFNKALISRDVWGTRTKYHIFDEAGNLLLYIEQPAGFQLKASYLVYPSEQRRQKLLSIQQDKIIQFLPRYSIADEGGQLIGRMKNKTFSVNTVWLLSDRGGIEVASIEATEVMLGRPRMPNFKFMVKEKRIGEFQKRGNNQYLLDLSSDSDKSVDRRLALASGIILDVATMK